MLIPFIFDKARDIDEDLVLAGSVINSIDLARTNLILQHEGGADSKIVSALRVLKLPLAAFDDSRAKQASSLIPSVRNLNIGLSGFVHIAAAIFLKMPVWTADRDWLKLDAPGANITFIRKQKWPELGRKRIVRFREIITAKRTLVQQWRQR